MSNPSTPFPFYSFVPDEDASKLNQDFDALVSFMTTELVHRHHIQAVTVTLAGLAAGTGAIVNNVAWPTPFPTGVTPYVLATLNDPTHKAFADTVTYEITGMSNTQFNVQYFNNGTGALPAGATLACVGIDVTFDVSQ